MTDVNGACEENRREAEADYGAMEDLSQHD